MITRIFRNSDGNRIAIELDGGDGDLLVTDYSYDPPITDSIVEIGGSDWAEVWVGMSGGW